MKLQYKIHKDCPHTDAISYPSKQGDVGYDLKIWLEDSKNLEIPPQEMLNIRTGVYFKLPEGYWGDIRPRSSTFAKRGLFVMGGTIDEGYVGEISIFVWNPTLKYHTVENGDRLAQLVVVPSVRPPLELVSNLPDTLRGDTGFGSTGRK